MLIDKISLDSVDLSGVTLLIAPLVSLRPHEEIDQAHAEYLASRMMTENQFTAPIIVCRNSSVILDGHHRHTALKKLLRASHIPAYLVDYEDNLLCQVGAWNDGDVVSKDEVIAAGLSGSLMKPKRSRHLFNFPRYPTNVPMTMLYS